MASAKPCRLEHFLEDVERSGGVETAVVEEEVSGIEAPVWGDYWPLILMQKELKLHAAIVRPRGRRFVVNVVEAARRHGVRLVVRGGGSNVVGDVLPCRCCAILDLSLLQNVEVYVEDRIVVAEAGARIDSVEEAARRHGLTITYLPQSHRLATVGGAVATLGVGAYSPGMGNIEDVVAWFEAVLANGETIVLGASRGPRPVGPWLHTLLYGSEGSLAVITRVALRARPLPEHVVDFAARMPGFKEALAAARDAVSWDSPEILRVHDEAESQLVYSVEGSVLVARLMGDYAEAVEARGKRLERIVERRGGRPEDPGLVEKWFRRREEWKREWEELAKTGLWVDTVDAQARWSVALHLRDKVLNELMRIKGFVAGMAHAGHFYLDGAALYFTLVFERNPSTYWRVWRRVVEAIVEAGAWPVHQHGYGLVRIAAGVQPDAISVFCGLARLLDALETLHSPLLQLCRRMS